TSLFKIILCMFFMSIYLSNKKNMENGI
ncbi:hypothetical protein EC930055_4794, partial [Escherichia coli 93.0055]